MSERRRRLTNHFVKQTDSQRFTAVAIVEITLIRGFNNIYMCQVEINFSQFTKEKSEG